MLIKIQDKQIKLMKEFMELEQRILYNILPANINLLDRLTPHHIYQPLFHDMTAIECNNQSTRIMQQLKRTWLNIYYKYYEMNLQLYEEQYIEHLHKLQLQFQGKLNINWVHTLNSIKTYLKERKQRLTQCIYTSLSDYRKKLLNNRKQASKGNKPIDVSAKPVFYLLSNPLNRQQSDYLAKGK